MSSWKPSVRPISTRRGRYGLEYRYLCPRCGKDNLWWVPSRGGGKCHTCAAIYGNGNLNISAMKKLFGEGSEHDGLAELVAMVGAREKKAPAPVVERQEVEDEFHWKFLWYAKLRRTLVPDLVRAGTWYDEGRNRICFPLSRIIGGVPGSVLVPFMSRSVSEVRKDWRVEPEGTLKELYWYNPVELDSREIVFVEGPFDVLAPQLLGKAVALCGTKFFEDAHLWAADMARKGHRFIVWLDNDEAGIQASKKVEGVLKGVSEKVSVIYYTKEPGDCEPAEAAGVIAAASAEFV